MTLDPAFLNWPRRPIFDARMVGVINTSPDSYNPASIAAGVEDAVAQARDLIRGGAHVLEVGGQSGSTFAKRVDAQTEKDRTLPVLAALAQEFPQVELSVDTFHASVASAAFEAGATWLNDVTALTFDARMTDLVREAGAQVALMHLAGPAGAAGRMLTRPHYDDVAMEVERYLLERARELVDRGVNREAIVLDPGLGAGKRPAHDYQLLAGVGRLVDTGFPVMIGPSRKGFIRAVAPSTVDDLIAGSVVGALWALVNGATYLRVHETKPYAQAIDVWNAIVTTSLPVASDDRHWVPEPES